MADIGTFLATKRLGAPTWVWGIGVVAVGAFIFLKYRASKNAATSTTSTGSGASTVAGVTNPSGYPVSQDFTTTTYNTNPPPNNTGSAPSVPGPLNQIQMGTYIVKGIDTSYPGGTPDSNGSVPDNWPDGIAQIVYNLDPNDKANHATDEVLIMMSNPTLVPPYANGTPVMYPINGPQGWVPAAQTTSTTAANNTNSASGS